MQNRNPGVNSRIRSTAFAALLFTLLGYLLLEAGLFRHDAGLSAHIISSIIGATLFGLTWRDAAAHQPAVPTDVSGSIDPKNSRLATPANTASFFLLMGIGYIAVDVVGGYGTTPVMLFAVCTYFCPWARIPLCRTSTLAPLCIITLGAAAHMRSGLRLPNPIILAFSVWAFWTIAAASLFTILLLKKRVRNAPPTAYLDTDVATEK
jgi:hypothetical protein